MNLTILTTIAIICGISESYQLIQLKALRSSIYNNNHLIRSPCVRPLHKYESASYRKKYKFMLQKSIKDDNEEDETIPPPPPKGDVY